MSSEINNSPMVKAIREAYLSGQEDEALEPLILVGKDGKPVGRITRGDSVIFYDLRGEREIQLTRALTENNNNFNHFPIEELELNFVTMIEYHPSLRTKVAFLPQGAVKNTLGEVISSHGLELVKIAESEKAIHLGYFMNGKQEISFPGEKRIIVPSPQDVSSYAEVPRLNADGITGEIIDQIKSGKNLVIASNYANVDVIGHIEDKEAVIEAVECVDEQLGKIIQAAEKNKFTLVVTSDHGTVEEWAYPDGTINTGHTRNPVPFILADFSSSFKWKLKPEGELADVAPTILELLNIPVPEEMTGESLLEEPKGKVEGKKLLLVILDGWGIRNEEWGNLIAQARTPNFDRLWRNYPGALLQAAGEAVGMPSHTVGNSEAGHLHIGAGRRVLLDRVRIDESIKNGEFFKNEALNWVMEQSIQNKRPLHLLGIVSHYSSHGTIKHLYSLLQLAKKKGLSKVFIHSLIGRRGERPESGAVYVSKVEEMTRELKLGKVVTVIGRFWALDREKNWDRIEKTYLALVKGKGRSVYIE